MRGNCGHFSAHGIRYFDGHVTRPTNPYDANFCSAAYCAIRYALDERPSGTLRNIEYQFARLAPLNFYVKIRNSLANWF